MKDQNSCNKFNEQQIFITNISSSVLNSLDFAKKYCLLPKPFHGQKISITKNFLIFFTTKLFFFLLILYQNLFYCSVHNVIVGNLIQNKDLLVLYRMVLKYVRSSSDFSYKLRYSHLTMELKPYLVQVVICT